MPVENITLEPGDWWRRKAIKHARYCIDSVALHTVYYCVPDLKRVFEMDIKVWHDVMEPCDADDVLEETGGIW
jgi:hypothetical protein